VFLHLGVVRRFGECIKKKHCYTFFFHNQLKELQNDNLKFNIRQLTIDGIDNREGVTLLHDPDLSAMPPCVSYKDQNLTNIHKINSIHNTYKFIINTLSHHEYLGHQWRLTGKWNTQLHNLLRGNIYGGWRRWKWWWGWVAYRCIQC
jgi:hypothetical protein